MKIHLLVFLFLAGPLLPSAFSQTECPFGLRDCPGACDRFTDKNGNGLCDYSEAPAPAQSTASHPKTSKTNAGKAATTTRQKSEAASTAAEAGQPNATAPAAPANVENHLSPASPASPSALPAAPPAIPAPQPRARISYYFLEIMLSTLILYSSSSIAVRLQLMKTSVHRKIWNLVLLVSFVVCGFLSLLLTAQVDLVFWKEAAFTVKFWHVEAGIVMAVVSIFHTIWHLPYYKKIFKS